MTQPINDAWAEEHAHQGDVYVTKAMDLENTLGSHESEAAAYALIAIAHYLAAGVVKP